MAIRGARTPEGGLLIEVADRGLGMPPKELAALNDRLAHGGDITADTARRMGLFVVGSLAKRHGIAVRLRKNGEDTDRQGITVSIHLPAGLLADTATVRPAPAASRAGSGAATDADASLEASAPPTSAVGGTTRSGLPTRVRGASGAPLHPDPRRGEEGAADAQPWRARPGRWSGPPGQAGHRDRGHACRCGSRCTRCQRPHAGSRRRVDGHARQRGQRPQRAGGSRRAGRGHRHRGGGGRRGRHRARPCRRGCQAAEAAVAADVADATDAMPAVTEPATEEGVVNGHTVDEAVSTASEAAATDETASQASPSALPKRQPRASRITEYREFEDAPVQEAQEGAPVRPMRTPRSRILSTTRRAMAGSGVASSGEQMSTPIARPQPRGADSLG